MTYSTAPSIGVNLCGVDSHAKENIYASELCSTSNIRSFTQGKLSEAEPLFQQSLAIRERKLDSEHPDVAASISNYGELLLGQVRRLISIRLRESLARLCF